jgi:hypothetical protein
VDGGDKPGHDGTRSEDAPFSSRGPE